MGHLNFCVLLEAGLLLVGGGVLEQALNGELYVIVVTTLPCRLRLSRQPTDPVSGDVQVDSGLGALGTAQIVYSDPFPEAVSCINRKF